MKEIHLIRKRPGMYVGSTDSRGVYDLFCLLFNYILDTYLTGNGNMITVEL
jgi:DNA gyrase/topoisomerase IV subunit B